MPSVPSNGVMLPMPKSVSPALIKPAPMAKTAILPSSVMTSAFVRKPMAAINGLSYTQIPGAASYAAAAPDGSLWVLSTQPAGADKYIWHYVSGTWTNISGLASRLSVAPNGTLYAINSGGGAYSYSGGTWTAFGGGCRDLTAAADGSLYVISNGGGSDGAIWHYATGAWTQVGGAGTRLAASWDSSSYTTPGGTITPDGLYVLNSAGSIYYLGTNGYVQIPGSASAVASMTGGLFALGYPANGSGNSLFYYDLSNPAWTAQAGSGVSISTNGATLYIVSSSGGIYSSPINTPAPSSTPTPATGTGAALTGNPTYKGGWTPYGVASALDYPVQHGWNGSGQNVAIVIDSDVTRANIQAYVTQFGIPMPTITTVSVDGASGVATNGDQVEAYLDVETVAGLAPGAHIYIYDMPGLDDKSIADAYSKIDSDGLAKVANSSFGGCETPNLPEDPFIAQGTQAGVTYVASSGDSGNVCDSVSQVGASWPASNPNVVAAGGTETLVSGHYQVTSNTVWNDNTCGSGSQCGGGGGVSSIYALPSYQSGLAGASSTSMRNEPDISLPAEDTIINYSTWGLVDGTSWSSPEYAALMAEVLQYCHLSSGLTNPVNVPYYVASHYKSAYIDVVNGNDQFGGGVPFYTAAAGYDNASGFGVPYGMAYANTACPGGTKAAGLVRSGMASQSQPHPVDSTLDVTPRVSGLVDRGRRSQIAMTPVMVVLRSESDRSAAEAALQNAGFSIDRRFEYRQIVHAQAPAATVEAFFGTQLHDVLQPRYGVRYMPATQVALPQSIAPYVRTVNLDNVVTRHVLNYSALQPIL